MLALEILGVEDKIEWNNIKNIDHIISFGYKHIIPENIIKSFDKKIIKIQGGTVKRLGNYNATLRVHRNVIHELSFEVVKSED